MNERDKIELVAGVIILMMIVIGLSISINEDEVEKKALYQGELQISQRG